MDFCLLDVVPVEDISIELFIVFTKLKASFVDHCIAPTKHLISPLDMYILCSPPSLQNKSDALHRYRVVRHEYHDSRAFRRRCLTLRSTEDDELFVQSWSLSASLPEIAGAR